MHLARRVGDLGADVNLRFSMDQSFAFPICTTDTDKLGYFAQCHQGDAVAPPVLFLVYLSPALQIVSDRTGGVRKLATRLVALTLDQQQHTRRDSA